MRAGGLTRVTGMLHLSLYVWTCLHLPKCFFSGRLCYNVPVTSQNGWRRETAKPSRRNSKMTKATATTETNCYFYFSQPLLRYVCAFVQDLKRHDVISQAKLIKRHFGDIRCLFWVRVNCGKAVKRMSFSLTLSLSVQHSSVI